MQVDPVGDKDDADLYTYTGNDPLDKADPTGNDANVFMGYSPADMQAMGVMSQANAIADAARAEAGNYENRQVMLKSAAAGTGVAALVPAATPVAAPASLLLSLTALVDTAMTKGEIELGEVVVTAIPLARGLGKVAALASGVEEASEVVKAGQEAVHVGATMMGAAAAVIEKMKAHVNGSNGSQSQSKPGASDHKVLCTGSRIPQASCN